MLTTSEGNCLRSNVMIVPVLVSLLCFGCGDDATNTRSLCDAGECTDVRIADVPEDLCDGSDCAICVIDERGGFCETDYCRLTVEPNQLTEQTRFELREGVPLPNQLEDVVGQRSCELSEPNLPLPESVQLTIRYDSNDIPETFSAEEFVAVDLAVFRLIDSVHAIAQREISSRAQGELVLAISAVPKTFSYDSQLGVHPLDVTDPEALQAELSKYDFTDSFYDGQRFYAANGPRVLIWNEGVPKPTTPPDIVLGRPNLGIEISTPTASNFSGSALGIWSDGEKLVVGEGNRVLIWNRIPTVSYTPADVVLGQADSASTDYNRGGPPDRDTIWGAWDVTSSGNNLLVSDFRNNRALLWTSFPTVTGQPADIVIGQPDFQTTLASNGATPLYQTIGGMFTESGLLVSSGISCRCFLGFENVPETSNPAYDFIVGTLGATAIIGDTDFFRPGGLSPFGFAGLAFRNGYRVSIWDTLPTTTRPADFTIGAIDTRIDGQLGLLSGSNLATGYPFAKVYADDSRMVVADGRRLLVYDTLPTHSFQAADWVIGQPGFTTNLENIDYGGIGSETLAEPTSVDTWGSFVAVADRSNNRVVIRDIADSTATPVILGQPDETSYFPNRDWETISSNSLNAPTGVAFGSDGRLAVADSGNNRVLIWNTFPSADQPADRVIGQPDFNSADVNRGGVPPNIPAARDDSLHHPSGVDWRADFLYVADTFNHRVIEFDANGVATGLWGQADYSQSSPNRNGDWRTPAPDGLARPMDVAVDGDRIWVADAENSRVIGFSTVGGEVAILGSSDGETNASPAYLGGANYGIRIGEPMKSASQSTLHRPSGVFVLDGQILVADTGNHRVVRFSDSSDATWLFGQDDFAARTENSNGLNDASVSGPIGVTAVDGTIWIADSGNHRVLGVPVESARASQILGQTNFARNGINGSAPARDRLDSPGGLAITKDTIWVADAKHHRLVGLTGGQPTAVIGQLDLAGESPNGGSSPSGATLNGPEDLWTDNQRLIVADRDNHRVLIWNEFPNQNTPADIVLGQPDFQSAQPNRGAGSATAAADSLLAPESVFSFNNAIYVADTANSRVLVWDTWPETNGQPADRVLCQPDFTTNAPNSGLGVATSSTCSSPSGVLVTQNHVWIADTVNNRVLRFGDSGEADLVLGQPNFESRSPVNAALEPDGQTFNSPSGIATDDTNLFIVDTGNHRVLAFPIDVDASGSAALYPIGQPSLLTSSPSSATDGLSSPRGVEVFKEPFRATTVYVSDGRKDRIAVFSRVPRPIPED